MIHFCLHTVYRTLAQSLQAQLRGLRFKCLKQGSQSAFLFGYPTSLYLVDQNAHIGNGLIQLLPAFSELI